MTLQTLGGVGVARDARSGTPDDLSGTTLAGRYDVLGLLGAGGMGAVYRARDRELDEIVALKVIRADHVHRRGMVEQFRHEVKLARRVTHVNIARTFELGVDGQVMFCTMELVEGESLRDRLLREGAQRVAKAAAIATALCDGLAVAHAAGVIHRDIKPENVLLTSRGRVVLADFGVAAFTAAENDGALVGTLEYMAPEQARGEQATPATDVYALGVVLFEMLTGLRAFAGTMSELIVAKQEVERLLLDFAESVAVDPLPAELKELVGKATARDPAARIATAAELGRRLQPFLSPDAASGTAGRTSDVSIVPAPTTQATALSTVVVYAPRATGEDRSRLHLAHGIHQELLSRLAQRRLRVLARATPVDEPGATSVELGADDSLHVTLRRGDLVSQLQLPLAVTGIGLAADAIAVAVAEMVAREIDTDADARLELLLRARLFSQLGFDGVRPAYDLLDDGRKRWPDDPKIACELAAVLLRYVFVGPDLERSFHAARGLVESARAGAPELAETHVAAGQLALHTGDPVHAAREFRAAIACSPYLAEPHEGLGRMLLEAGFLGDAMGRLDDALAIAPQLSSVRWEIARAHALEGNWLAHDRVVSEVIRDGDRPIARLRFALWRKDREGIAETFDAWRRFRNRFEPELVEKVFSSLLQGNYQQQREGIFAACLESSTPSKRRHAFLSQVVAEISGEMGDVDGCLRFLDRAVQYDLFDRHWFDLCPTIAVARATDEGQRLQRLVRNRAEAILDALYGDRESIADTVFVPVR